MKFTESIRVTNDGGIYATTAIAGNHRITGDEPLDHGGKDLGPTAHQLLLSALGLCITITLRMYADRKKWDLQKAEILLNMEKKVIDGEEKTIIYKKLILSGNLSEEQRERLAIIAARCPVHKTLSQPVEFADRPDLS